ncbi:hypothetical protein MRB53_034522 [Persea americana]|uniref:Uncharacterized protein n=1 Tax=Persea americana TaxID=3435 RepID=A0ACC2K238_PERAE|nr:hypothetical protein MRB53_034522 [Persea americana]
MNLIPNNQVPITNEPPLAQELPSPPPPPLASSSQPLHNSSPQPTPSSSFSHDRLGALERDVAYMKKEQSKKKKDGEQDVPISLCNFQEL